MTHQQEQEIYNRDWNAGYEAFLNGGDAFGCSHKSAAWNEGFAAARANMEVDAAERDCIADYDAAHGCDPLYGQRMDSADLGEC